MTERLVWERDGRDWPNRTASRFVVAGGLRWHVQQMGVGPVLLMIHGTGASTHSWRDLAPLLARDFTVLAADLPGHGFTQPPPALRQLSLEGMATALAALVDATGLAVHGVVGHSAGAAIGARMVLDRRIVPRGLVGLNAALLPLPGVAALIFPPVARLMAATSLAARLFARRAGDRGAVERLIAGTGSTLDARGIELYRRLVSDVGHVSSALGMMAHWRPAELRLSQLTIPVGLLGGKGDRAVPADDARRLVGMMPKVDSTTMPGVGHLAHEERPEQVARWITEWFGALTTKEERSSASAARVEPPPHLR